MLSFFSDMNRLKREQFCNLVHVLNQDMTSMLPCISYKKGTLKREEGRKEVCRQTPYVARYLATINSFPHFRQLG